MTDQPYVLSRIDGPVLTVTLNRGDRYNPLSMAMLAALQEALDQATTNETVRVVVLAAAGKGFSAGHDLKEMRSRTGDDAWQQKLFDDCGRVMLSLHRLPQPVIARVHGIATAAGCQLVSMCDLAIASEAATFALPGVHVGIFCSTPAVGVARNIGRKRVMEMLLTGRPISAATALQWGLVNRVVTPDRLDQEVQAFADQIAAQSAATIALGKATFYRQVERGVEPAYQVAAEAMTCNMTYPDAAEGIDAFLGKRAPKWTGR